MRITVYFENPIDGGGPHRFGREKWRRTGDTFETLTLSPSVNFEGGCGRTGWHGYVRAGEITTCG